jgi:DNA-binding response OmpR family regulator
VLIIDDDAYYAHCLKQTFASAGIACLHASAAPVGMEMARRERPSVILLALLVNGIEGSETLASLKADADTQSIPVMMLTNAGMREDVERCSQKGACAFIIKSQHRPDELLACVQKMISTI